jgi:hypothetical protein
VTEVPQLRKIHSPRPLILCSQELCVESRRLRGKSQLLREVIRAQRNARELRATSLRISVNLNARSGGS